MLRAAQNRHTITVVALSVAFALVAIGFVFIYRATEIVNFAHRGQIVAAITVIGSDSDIRTKLSGDLATTLLALTQACSRALGHTHESRPTP